MASTVQSTASALLPEAPPRPSPARGNGRSETFGVRLDEAVAAPRDRAPEPAPRSTAPATARDRGRGATDRAASGDARADTSEARTGTSRDAAHADARQAPAKPARASRQDAARQDDEDGQALASGQQAAKPPVPDTVPATPSPEDGASAEAGTVPDETKPAKDDGKNAKDGQDAASAPADPALAALVATLGDAVPAAAAPPAATSPAPAAAAMLQPVLMQPAEPQPAPPPAEQQEVAAVAATSAAREAGATAAAPRTAAARQPSPASAAGPAPAEDGETGPGAAGSAPGEPGAAAPARKNGAAEDAAALPDLRLPALAAKADQAVPTQVTAAPAAPAAPPAPASVPGGDVPAATEAKPGSEAAKDGAASAGRAGEAKAAGDVQGTDKTSQAPAAQREFQVTAFSLDPASAGNGAVHAPGLHRDAQAASQLPAAPGQVSSQAPAVPVQAVPIEIGMRVLEGAQQFTVRLHPEDLGRVDVRIGVDDDGKVTAQLVVDKVETLAMLQRDSRTLERAFDQAGLKTSEGSLQFTLNTGAGQQQSWSGGDERQRQQTNVPNAATKIEPPEDLMAAIRRVQAGPGGLDIRI